ncbi:sodium:phosphate symporter [Paenibacillus stellifer]|uniref:Sodium:phosphate symporter n=1 Tax=Paenibacillus stellifer TaxID=169760 RepID=A0A089LY14_9BACL|nr:Na/Pi symporter [Paenibacillus stellifer]AIQ65030.1 sodium:phosphate symporter [Paenibacillus stellifer]
MFSDLLFPVMYGIVIFLAGMKLMEAALSKLAGPILEDALGRATSTPLMGMLTSSVVTALLQSSTAVTVLAIGMVNAGLLSFGRTLGIILGSNIGTCLTTELAGLEIARFAGPLLAVSLALWAAAVTAGELPAAGSRLSGAAIALSRPLQFISLAAAGFALVLWGISVMQSIGPALQSSGMFRWFLDRASESVLWGFAAGACLTALLHSSSATIGMAMGVASSGALPPHIGIAIVLGANVGTCITAVIASVGGSISGIFVAWSHVVLNAGGALLFLPFTGLLLRAAELIGGGPAAQIAHSQTIFNIGCSLLALPFCYLPLWKRVDLRLSRGRRDL